MGADEKKCLVFESLFRKSKKDRPFFNGRSFFYGISPWLPSLYRLEECLKYFRVFHCKMGKRLSVELDMTFLFNGNEFRIGKPMFSESVSQSNNPKTSELPFFCAPISVCVFSSFNDGFFSCSVVGLPAPVISFRVSQYVLSSFVGSDAALYSRHSLIVDSQISVNSWDRKRS